MALVSEFLVYLAFSLPLYGVVVLMQKSFSALLDMKPYSRYCLYSAIGQAGSVLLFGVMLGLRYAGNRAFVCCRLRDLWSAVRCGGCVVACVAFRSNLSCMAVSFGLLLGGLGAAAGAGVMWALELFVGALWWLDSGLLLATFALRVSSRLLLPLALPSSLRCPRSRRCFVASRCAWPVTTTFQRLPSRFRARSYTTWLLPLEGCQGRCHLRGQGENLRARMRQYVTLQDERQKIPLMMQLVASFDYIVVETEHEALVLERNLIGQYHPYFNVDLKDDKSYPFIAITKGDLYPVIKYTREP